MPEWTQNPLLWIVALAAVLGIVFRVWRLIAWVGNINSDWKSFKRLTGEFPTELKELRKEVRDEFTEVHNEFKEVRKEMKNEFTEVRKEMQNEFIEVRKEMKNEFKDVREDIKRILIRLSPAASGESPLQLTDFGRTISKDASATEWAKEEAAGLVELSKGKEEFEIFEMCIDFVSQRYAENNDFKRFVKSTAYRFGTDSNVVLDVYQIELRDQILELLPE